MANTTKTETADPASGAKTAEAVDKKEAPSEAGPDPDVSRAFALGWQVAQLHRRTSFPVAAVTGESRRLGGTASLSHQGQIELGLAQIDAALHLLGERLTSAGIEAPSMAELRKLAEADPEGALRRRVADLHAELLIKLTAADFRLGKAYGLGRALMDTCRSSETFEALSGELEFHRVGGMQETLVDLASAFPAHAARAVSLSLDDWRRWAEEPTAGSEALRWPAHAGAVQESILRQGHLWRALLSGEKQGTDMLGVDDYLWAADRLLVRTRTLTQYLVNRYRRLLVIVAVIVFSLLAALFMRDNPSAVLVSAGGALAALGLTWKGFGAALASVTARLDAPLWGVELDYAIAAAITRLPGQLVPPGPRRDEMRASGPMVATPRV